MWLLREATLTHKSVWQAAQLAQLKGHGSRVYFERPVSIHEPEQVEVGSDVHLAEYVQIWGGGGLRIGSRVMIGSHAAISTVTHDYSGPTMYQTLVIRAVTVEDDVWVGAHAMIMPGVTVGAGAVIGAGAIVINDVPSGAIVVGVPARFLKWRINMDKVQ
jgi:acetyltransferase-like isoleucine patch superfamily enzyme